ncbi:MAG: archease [Candidatus Bathyarchaeota archaeon]|jgi:SHS2 domain-containing protein
MNKKKAFDFLEHTADAYVAAYGEDLAQAFENAAVAMFEVMTEVAKIEEKIEEYVEVQAEDEFALLYSWLEDLLVKFDVNAMLYSRFKVSNISRTPEGFQLKAKIWGEKFSTKKHVQKVGVKAITYHRMEIIKQPKNVTVKYILDI